MQYGPRLQSIADLGGGELSAEGVLLDARLAQSPLHSFFEWDDSEAAQQYRLAQARLMIRSVAIVYVDSRGNEAQTRAFPSVAYADERTDGHRRKHRYLTAQRVFDDEDTRAEIVAGYRRRINSLRRDMRQTDGLGNACHLLDEAAAQLSDAS